MECGVSTACFYPEKTLQGLSHLGDLGVSCVEVFLNTFCELSPEYANRLSLILQKNNMHISALHPFTSGMETFFFATDYPTRIEDGYTLYRRYFSFCQMLHIPRFVFHGMHKGIEFPFERYAEHYLRLREIARSFGVDFLQENVVRCACCSPNAVMRLRELTHGDIGFVLDIKQARRAKVSSLTMLESMGANIEHLHLSDFTNACDCTVPGTGTENFPAIAEKLHSWNKNISAVLEVYRTGFTDPLELSDGLIFLKQIFKQDKGAEPL